MDFSQTAHPNIIEIDSHSDDDPIPGAQKLSYAGKTIGLKNLKVLPSKNTPSRQSLFNASPASSIRSFSPNPSIFDDDSSPAGTLLLTPPLLDKPYPSASLRLKSVELKETSRRLFDGKHPKQSGSFNASPSSAAHSPRGTPRRPSTPELGDQNAEQHSLEPMNDILPYLSLDTPVRQKVYRPKLGRGATATPDAISIQLGSMSLEHDDTITRRRSEIANHAVDEEIVAVEVVPSDVISHDIDVLDDDKRERPEVLRLQIETECSKVAKNVPRSPTPEIENSDEVHQQPFLCSPIIPVPTPSKLKSKSKKSTKSLSLNHSCARLRSRSEPQPQLNKSIGSPSVSRPASSSNSRKRAPRKSKNQSSHSKGVEAKIIDLTTESHLSPTTNPYSHSEGIEAQIIDLTMEFHSPLMKSCISERMEQVADFNFEKAESTDIFGNPNKTSMPHRETALNIQEESKVTGHKFEKFNDNEEKEVNELKLNILGAVRRKPREDILAKYFFTTLFILAFPYAIRNLFSKIFSKRFPKYPFTSSDMDEGFIYIFKLDDYPGYFKIGKTKQTPAERIKQWTRQCRFICVHILDPNDKLFKHYGIVEKLVQAELWNERRKFKCKQCKRGKKRHELEQSDDCETEHGEWYEITEAHALELVEKWRSWIVTHRPYTRHAVLTPFWKWKYQQAMDGGEVDWVKWRSPESFERLSYAWSCIRAFPEEDLPSVVGFVLVFIVVSALISLFHPIDVSVVVLANLALAISLCIIFYKRVYY